MTHNEFNHIISCIDALTTDQMRQIARELKTRMAALGEDSPEESAFDVAQRAGLIGCIKGESGSSTDLSTNPRHGGFTA